MWMTTGDANEEMERPLSKKASTIWGFDEEDDAALETQQLAECSDIQMIRGFSDSESDEEEAPRGGRARNPTREDGDDEGHSPFLDDVDRSAPSDGTRRASSSSGTRFPRQVEKNKRSSNGRAPPDEALEKLRKPSSTQSDSPPSHESPSQKQWDAADSASASETESWDGNSDGGAGAMPKGLGPPPAGLLQEPEEHTWAGGLFDCFSTGTPGKAFGTKKSAFPDFFPTSLLCPWITLGSNASMLQDEEPIGVKCLGLGKRGTAVAAASFCFPLAIAPCLGVGILASFQRRQIMRKYNIPGHGSCGKSCLLPCLCAPCALHQHSVFLAEQRSWRSSGIGKGKKETMRAPLDQSMDRKELLHAEDSCRGSDSASNIESSMAVDVDGIAVDAGSDDEGNAEPRGDQLGSGDAQQREEAFDSGSDDDSDDLSDDDGAGAAEDGGAAAAPAPSGMQFWSGILDDDDMSGPGQKQPEHQGNKEEDGASCIKGAKEGSSAMLEPQSNGGGASLGGFWSGILDGDDDCAPAKAAPRQRPEATKGSRRVSSGANEPSGNDWDTASEASDGPEEPKKAEKPLSKQGSNAPVAASRPKEEPRDASPAPPAASGGSSASFWEGILPADSIPAPTSNSKSGNEDDSESLQSSDAEEWDTDDSDHESSRDEPQKQGAAGGAGPRMSGKQAPAPVRNGQSNFWDGILDDGGGTVVEEADAVPMRRSPSAARPALSLFGRSSSGRSANRPASASPGGSRQQGSLRQAFGGTESGHRRSGSGGASASAALSPVEGPLRLRKANQAAAPAWGAPSPSSVSPVGRGKVDLFDVAAPETDDGGKAPLPSPHGIRKAAPGDQAGSVHAEAAAVAEDDDAASTTKWASPAAPADSRAAPSQPEDLHTGDIVAGSDSDWDSDDE